MVAEQLEAGPDRWPDKVILALAVLTSRGVVRASPAAPCRSGLPPVAVLRELSSIWREWQIDDLYGIRDADRALCVR
jgi:hypothetical protein